MADAIDVSKGIVAWFDVARGFGFISPEDGGENLFVHQSSIKAMSYCSLSVGDAVEFIVSVGDDGRRRAVSVTGPRGAYINRRRYFAGSCYRCGQVGHKAMYCRCGVPAGNRLGPCFNCWQMGHLVRDCPDMRIDPSHPTSNILEPSSPSDYKVEIPSENIYSEEEEEISDDDSEFLSAGEKRNWVDLPRDVLSMIFKKITSVDIIRSAQYVCRSWRQLSYEPELWRHIVVAMTDDLIGMSELESLAMLAVERSQGCVEEFHIESFASQDDELVHYMADRTTKLRHLRLIAIYNMSETALAQAIKKFPLLEELEISFCAFSSKKLLNLVSLACLQLKSFRLNEKPCYYPYNYDRNFDENSDSDSDSDEIDDAEAFFIAKHMQQLECLQLIGNRLTNTGLLAILNSCPNLQCLDIRACLNVNFDETLKRKCAKVKELRHPKDSTADFELSAFLDHHEASDFYDFDPDNDGFGFLDHPEASDFYDFDPEDDDFGYYDHEIFFDASFDGIFM